MNEVKESLRSIEQKYKLFQQQQFTFIAALEHCRENAHDKIQPIASIGQVAPWQGQVALPNPFLGPLPAQFPHSKIKQQSPGEEA
jgi:hypothetical protein